MYLETFRFPIEQEGGLLCQQMIKNGGSIDYGYVDNPYPCNIFSGKRFYEINFEKVTILYGGNGSGKSTALNLIAEKLRLERTAPYNSGEMFNSYVEACTFVCGTDDEGKQLRIPKGSSIITSDDVFDYMLAIRSNNEEIGEEKENARAFWNEVRSGNIDREQNILENFEKYRNTVLARNKNVSRRKFIRKTAGQELQMRSNGETAIDYFDHRLKNDKLYCLDEPENSLSPKLQMELVKLLETVSRYCGCQLIIATHSPFIMSLPGARIYDLDENPVDIKNWWELENVLTYYEFFKKHEALFEEALSSPKPEKKEEGKNIRRPLGSSWLMMNRTELAHMLVEKRYPPLLVKKIWGLVDASPDLEKESVAEHILEYMEEAADEKELEGLLEELQIKKTGFIPTGSSY